MLKIPSPYLGGCVERAGGAAHKTQFTGAQSTPEPLKNISSRHMLTNGLEKLVSNTWQAVSAGGHDLIGPSADWQEISQLSCQVLIQETGVCKLTQINWRNASACH
jgi:hypothetical protein